MIKINPDWFDETKETADTKALNDAILKKCANWSNWAQPIAETRRLRAEGKGPFPPAPLSKRAYTHDLDGINLRIIEPKTPAKGVYYHIHGGGWVLGSADMQDPRLEKIADDASLIVVSVDYRLMPSHTLQDIPSGTVTRRIGVPGSVKLRSPSAAPGPGLAFG